MRHLAVFEDCIGYSVSAEHAAATTGTIPCDRAVDKLRRCAIITTDPAAVATAVDASTARDVMGDRAVDQGRRGACAIYAAAVIVLPYRLVVRDRSILEARSRSGAAVEPSALLRPVLGDRAALHFGGLSSADTDTAELSRGDRQVGKRSPGAEAEDSALDYGRPFTRSLETHPVD